VQEEKCFSVQCGAFLLWFFFALSCLALPCFVCYVFAPRMTRRAYLGACFRYVLILSRGLG
jgi:hypothetical protein